MTIRIPKELYKDIPKLKEYCLRQASCYIGIVKVIDKLSNEKVDDRI